MQHTFAGHHGPISHLLCNSEMLFGFSGDKCIKSWHYKEDKMLFACHFGITQVAYRNTYRTYTTI